MAWLAYKRIKLTWEEVILKSISSQQHYCKLALSRVVTSILPDIKCTTNLTCTNSNNGFASKKSRQDLRVCQIKKVEIVPLKPTS